MSNGLECIVEPFYAPEFKKEVSFTETAMPQDENKCQANMPSMRQVASRKREASNVLVECAKKRENLQNIFCVSDASFWPTEIRTDGDSSAQIANSEKSSATDNFPDVDSPMSVELSDTSAADSGTEMPMTADLVNQNVDASSTCFVDESHLASATICNTSILPDESKNDNTSQTDILHSSNSEDLNQLSITEPPTRPKTRRPALVSSLFPTVPPVLYFPTEDEEVEKLPDEIISLLKWKLSTITPVIIKDLVTEVGFTMLDAETNDNWIGLWGKHLKCQSFRSLQSFQKVNHYPGGYHLGRKDRLWENFKKMLPKHGEEYNFLPSTFVLPADKKLLRSVWDDEFCWIIKPCASARGTGVKVISKWSQVPKDKPYVVQKYISDPYLINGTKFDLRVYVLVPSIEPLRIYLYEDGLARFASKKYCTTSKSLKNSYIHLTNYSINRRSASYTSNNDETQCQGHKWSLKSFWVYMAESGIDVPKIKQKILDMIIKTIICSEGPICRQMKMYAGSAYNCFELFGFDIMLDKDLKPWLLEVNISPSLHTKSVLDHKIKAPMIRDMLNIIGFEIPQILTPKSDADRTSECHSPTKMVGNRHKHLKLRTLSVEEKKKHSLFTFMHDEAETNILEKLTLDDLSCLMESEDELQRAGKFTRIFPTTETHSYDVYFDHIRYYNVLLDAWEHVYAHDRQKGINLLVTSCETLREEEQERSSED